MHSICKIESATDISQIAWKKWFNIHLYILYPYLKCDFEKSLLATCTNYTINGTENLMYCSIIISSKCLLWVHEYHVSTLWYVWHTWGTSNYSFTSSLLLIHSLTPNQSLWKKEMRRSGYQITYWNVSSGKEPEFPYLQRRDDIPYSCGFLYGWEEKLHVSRWIQERLSKRLSK